MTPLAAALVLAAAAQVSPTPTPAPDPAAALAGPTFAFGCLQRLGAVGSAAEFARGSDELGVRLAREHPAESASVRLDGADGRGCRIRYTGPSADRLWSAFAAVLVKASPPGAGGCTVSERTDLRIRASCIDTAPTPPHRADLVMERSGGGASAGSVSVALAWRPPAG